MLQRAQGCLLGQLAGDSLGGLVEFRTAVDIQRQYPDGVRQLADGGTWNTIAGQPTDDSEMALMLARTLVHHGRYQANQARDAYLFWFNSDPFDCGHTTAVGLQGRPNLQSQANGAMMRISPLAIFGAHSPLPQLADWARQDAAITHPHPLCQEANALFVMAIASAIRQPLAADALYEQIVAWAQQTAVAHPTLLDATLRAADERPSDYQQQQGWVLIAWQNALWQLCHAPDLETAVVDTVMQGGDTDTNAAICGALLGAVYGVEAIPAQWRQALLDCRPEAGRDGVYRPRPIPFWPADALWLAEQLLAAGLVK